MRSWLSRLKADRIVAGPRVEESPSFVVCAFWIGLGLLILGWVCRLHVYWLSFPIWRDEASLALNLVSRGYGGLLDELDNFQVAPLLFLWIEKAAYQCLGDSPALLRLAPLLAGLTALLLFWQLARRNLTPMPAALSVGYLAVAQAPIHLASMVKPYSFDLFAATLILLLAVHYLRNARSSNYLAALALFAPVLVTVSYPAVFVVGSVSMVLLPVVWRQGSYAGRIWYLAFNMLCMVTFVAHLQLVGRAGHDPTLPTVSAYMAEFWDGGFLPRELRIVPRWLLHCHTGHLFSYPLSFNGGGLLGLLLVVTGAHALYRQRRLDLLGLCLLPLALNFLAGVLRRYPYAADQRLEQHLVPGICLLLGSGAADLIRVLPAGRRLSVAALTGLFVLIGLLGSVRDVLHPYQDVEAAWAADIAQQLHREVRPQDRIVIPCSERFTLNCLRWQLRPFVDQICAPTAVDWPKLERNKGRLWFIDQMVEQAPAVLELPARDPRQISPQMERVGWHDVRRVRFLAREPKSEVQSLFHYCCDLHVLEQDASQSWNIGNSPSRQMAFWIDIKNARLDGEVK